MLPDDTLDLLKGTRKGKNEVKNLDHIVGISDLQSRQKAKDQRLKAVTTLKTSQLQKTLMALGIYLRRFFTENIERDNLQLDTHYFGKFSIVADPDADIDALYP